MKKITLLAAMMITMVATAQQTFTIDDWQQGTNGNSASFIIEEGDTVIWTWGNASGHNLVPIPGETDAPSDFGVQTITSNEGFVYEYTFTDAAEIDYQCDPHAATMFGTIIVEEVLGVQDKFEVNLKFFPNPVGDSMTISSLFHFDEYEIYNVNGRKVGQGIGEGVFTDLDSSYLDAGVYFVKVTAGDLTTTKRIIKK